VIEFVVGKSSLGQDIPQCPRLQDFARMYRDRDSASSLRVLQVQMAAALRDPKPACSLQCPDKFSGGDAAGASWHVAWTPS